MNREFKEIARQCRRGFLGDKGLTAYLVEWSIEDISGHLYFDAELEIVGQGHAIYLDFCDHDGSVENSRAKIQTLRNALDILEEGLDTWEEAQNAKVD